jgi:CRP/FNR family transcriptional regulator, anaerobic regulatory protein
MQLFNTQKSHTANSEIDRLQQLNLIYPQLADITEQTWIDTIDHARLLETKPDTTLFSGASSCNNFMLILEGNIRIYQTAEDGREITLYRVEAGELCILSLNSLLKNKSFNAIAVTESNVTALVISSESFKAMMNEIESFRNYVISTLTERLCETIYLIQNTAFNHLNMRLACMLGGLFERSQGSSLKITHQELAFELGTTREVISRILKEFENQNCIELSRGHIKLASADGLKWFSQPA